MIHQLKRFNASIKRTKERLLKNQAVQLILLTVEAAGNHDAAQRAAGVAYYAFLSIFPTLLGLIGLFSFFLPLLICKMSYWRLLVKTFRASVY